VYRIVSYGLLLGQVLNLAVTLFVISLADRGARGLATLSFCICVLFGGAALHRIVYLWKELE
jgi:hypothetical protein